MIAVGTDPGSITNGGKSATDYLLARQDSDGHFNYSSSSDQTPVWVTGQALPAIAGKAFPVSPPPRAPKPKPAPAGESEGGSSAPFVPSTPGGSAIPKGLPPSTGGSGSGSGSGSGPITPPAATPGPPIPVSPSTEGAEPETPPAPRFEAKNAPPGPQPLAPIAVGVGAGGLALGSVLLLGRRFGW
jgi:hypothetical protein